MLGRHLSHYKILDEISRGGMGIVYRAVDLKLEREVAVKVLRPGLVSDPERRGRFVREARAASKLTHPPSRVTDTPGSARPWASRATPTRRP